MDIRNEPNKQTITCLIHGGDMIIVSKEMDGKVSVLVVSSRPNKKGIVTDESMMMILGEPGEVHRFSI